MKFYDGLPGILVGTALVSAIALVQPLVTLALTGEEVNDVAREITVLIRGNGGHGSGVIIAKDENTYYVLTANHVIKESDDYKLVTHDKQAYQLDRTKAKALPGVDLAVVEFTSNENYQVAKLANSDTVTEGKPVFISGWPKPGGTGQLVRQFTDGRVSGFLDRPVEGYKMIYTNVTLPGMSGGPVVDAGGRVVGIHGWGDTADPHEIAKEGLSPEAASTIARLIKPGFNYAIPINTFLTLAPQQGIYLGLKVENEPAPELDAAYVASTQPDERDTIEDIDNVLNDVNRGIETVNEVEDTIDRVRSIFSF